MNVNELYLLLEIDKDLVTGFSVFFSRFEYALKRTIKYAVGDENGVEANWNKFAKENDSGFNPERTSELKSAVNYLQEKPPKKQNIKNGTLGWKNVQQQNILILEQIICTVCRVRNNLFHGGKFPDGPIEEPRRDIKLLQSCIIILEECRRLDDVVCMHFCSK